MTQLHLVGGFLGSGKTTAIIQACKTLIGQHKRVGVITNDQGKYLVDTAFFQLDHVPTLQVTGGCFCCNYDDLNERLGELIAAAHPDVIFAESVGSCADLVATVIEPLLSLSSLGVKPDSFSVFVDARLLRLLLAGEELPFSENINYIFEKQIEEAQLLVVNKWDLLPANETEALLTFARRRYPDKEIFPQHSLTPDGIANWLARLDDGNLRVPALPLEIDYQRYGDGEAELAWLDERIDLKGENTHDVVISWFHGVLAALDILQAPIGHLKLILSPRNGVETKLSFTTPITPGWETQIPKLRGDTRILLNARVQMDADSLQALIHRELDRAAQQANVWVQRENIAAFHPGFPRPTHGR